VVLSARGGYRYDRRRGYAAASAKDCPYGVACELAYTGRNMSAEEAQQVGLVNRVFKDRDELLREVRAIAANIASKSPLAVRGSKEMLLFSRDHSVQEGLNYIATWNAGMLSSRRSARGHDRADGKARCQLRRLAFMARPA
jgi:enoyl-CoA hydratase/carnithine racemase